MFVVYDKDGNEHKINHEIDYRTAIRGGVLTAEKPVKKAEAEVENKPGTKKRRFKKSEA